MKLCQFENGVCVACGALRANERQVCGTGLQAAWRPALREWPVRAAGPGTELSKLLKRFGIEPTPTCACRAKAAEMDAWGCAECSKPDRIEQVVAVMREEAKARGLPFLDAVSRFLVKRAIANARKNQLTE